jgi:hypothetical protein
LRSRSAKNALRPSDRLPSAPSPPSITRPGPRRPAIAAVGRLEQRDLRRSGGRHQHRQDPTARQRRSASSHAPSACDPAPTRGPMHASADTAGETTTSRSAGRRHRALQRRRQCLAPSRVPRACRKSAITAWSANCGRMPTLPNDCIWSCLNLPRAVVGDDDRTGRVP